MNSLGDLFGEGFSQGFNHEDPAFNASLLSSSPQYSGSLASVMESTSPRKTMFDNSADMDYLFNGMGSEMRSLYTATSSGQTDLEMFPSSLSPSILLDNDNIFGYLLTDDDPLLGLENLGSNCSSSFNSSGLLMQEVNTFFLNGSQSEQQPQSSAVLSNSLLSNNNILNNFDPNQPSQMWNNIRSTVSQNSDLKASLDVIMSNIKEQHQNPLVITVIPCGEIGCNTFVDTPANLQAHLAAKHQLYLCIECGMLDYQQRCCYTRRCDLSKHHQHKHSDVFARLQEQLALTVPLAAKKRKKTTATVVEPKVKDEEKENIIDGQKKMKTTEQGGEEPKNEEKSEQAAAVVVAKVNQRRSVPVQCPQCSKWFPTLSKMRSHQRNHLGERKHACDKCGRRFLYPSKLISHLKVHDKL